MTKFSDGISPLLKEPIILGHLRCDMLEQVDAHPKIDFGKYRILIEIRLHQLLSTEHRTTYFWLFDDAVC
jgi:hypothetical protein